MNQIFCPACKRANEKTATKCVYCGALIEIHQGTPAPAPRIGTTVRFPDQAEYNKFIQNFQAPEQGIGIYLEDLFNPIIVEVRPEFILGRKRPETTLENLIDMTPYGGYEKGVSQAHALFRKNELGYEVLDLGSTNGTWMDNKRLMPKEPYFLRSGTQVNLGRLSLAFIYKPG